MITFCFFFNDTATTEIYPLSLHDALPILDPRPARHHRHALRGAGGRGAAGGGGLPGGAAAREGPLRRRAPGARRRTGEQTSELQPPQYFVCRLLLVKKNRRLTRRHTAINS